jgi:N-acetylglucosaminyldiphosphoundecaprenol N-acetyl-beta-D-mannosaminyltransferase
MKIILPPQSPGTDSSLSFFNTPARNVRAGFNEPELKEMFLLSIKINLGHFSDFIDEITAQKEGESFYVCIANVHMLIEAYRNRSFAKAINGANLVTPDGKPLAWALRLLHGLKQERVCGMDMLPCLLQAASDKELPVIFYGGSSHLVDTTKHYLNTNYKQLKVSGFISPPFRELTEKEDDDIVNQINSSGARIVFVILGCPKQEKWMAAMQGRVNAVMVGIGGALTVLVGLQKRAPRWMQDNGFEWLFRLLLEPRRLLKRYAVTNTIFLALFFAEFVKVKFGRLFKAR